MSDTPRIDATQYQWTRTLDLARTLERELAAAHAASEALQPGIDHLRETCDALERERNEARETVDYRNALVRSLADSLKKITFMARTSGGWKPDAELIAACEQAEQLLSLPGMSKVIDERDALRAEVEALREVLIGIRDRDFKLSDAKRRARRALTRVEEPKPVCGECHLQPGERCDVCGATDPRPKPAEEPK